MRAHDADGARELYARALALEPGYAEASFDAAGLELVAGNLAEARLKKLNAVGFEWEMPSAPLTSSLFNPLSRFPAFSLEPCTPLVAQPPWQARAAVRACTC